MKPIYKCDTVPENSLKTCGRYKTHPTFKYSRGLKYNHSKHTTIIIGKDRSYEQPW